METKLDRYRRVLAIVSIAVSTYYILWRTTTFNPEAPIFSLIVYGAELYGFLGSLMFFYMVWRFAERKSPKPPEGFTVDVFIPTLNESVEVLRKTIEGALSMRYPHKTYVLDDGNRPEVKKLCEELGCEYISRLYNTYGKAGNLNHALARTEGEFIAVFDADHVPEPDFLEKTLGYFRDPKVAFVQTPQDFYNIDSYQHRIMKGKLWQEQSLFFRVIMRGKDRHNASFFCGSCAVIRRKALEDIGGFATGTITEDLHTSIKLHARGWKSVYHPETLAYGVAPSTIKPFKTQRERWGQGAMQVFRSDNPLTKKGLTLAQRINYFASMSTYFDGFQKVVYYVAPVVVLLTGTFPISVNLKEFLMVFIPHIVLSLWAFEEMSRGYGKLVLLEQYNMARFFTFMKSVLGFFRWKLRFKVTNKENGRKVGVWEVIPQGLVLVGSLAGIAYAGLNLNSLPNRDLYVANMFWASLNTAIAVACILWTLKKKHLRKTFRFPANFPAVLSVRGVKTAVTVGDIHEGGASVFSGIELARGEEVYLNLKFHDVNLTLRSKVLYSVKTEEEDVFKIGLMFEDVTPEERSLITLFDFRFLLKKFMDEYDKPYDTPMSFVAKVLGRKIVKRKGERRRTYLPGLVLSQEDFVPYTTEDIGGGGVRILTYEPIKADRLTLSVGSGRNRKVINGRVVWSKEVNFYGIKGFRYGLKIDKESQPNPVAEGYLATT